MDIICPRCAEPCDMDELHDVTDQAKLPAWRATELRRGTLRADAAVIPVPLLPYDAARVIFFDSSRGCGVLFTGTPCEDRRSDFRAQASAAMADLMGDDVDGIASSLEDFEYAGLLG